MQTHCCIGWHATTSLTLVHLFYFFFFFFCSQVPSICFYKAGDHACHNHSPFFSVCVITIVLLFMTEKKFQFIGKTYLLFIIVGVSREQRMQCIKRQFCSTFLLACQFLEKLLYQKRLLLQYLNEMFISSHMLFEANDQLFRAALQKGSRMTIKGILDA